MLDLEELFFCFQEDVSGETFYLDLSLRATGFCCYVMVFVVVIFED